MEGQVTLHSISLRTITMEGQVTLHFISPRTITMEKDFHEFPSAVPAKVVHSALMQAKAATYPLMFSSVLNNYSPSPTHRLFFLRGLRFSPVSLIPPLRYTSTIDTI